jgi:uncharacterized membrane protein YgcG
MHATREMHALVRSIAMKKKTKPPPHPLPHQPPCCHLLPSQLLLPSSASAVVCPLLPSLATLPPSLSSSYAVAASLSSAVALPPSLCLASLSYATAAAAATSSLLAMPCVLQPGGKGGKDGGSGSGGDDGGSGNSSCGGDNGGSGNGQWQQWRQQLWQ